MENKKIYLAIPYNDLDSTVRQRRFEIANQVSADLFNKGYNVFSPRLPVNQIFHKSRKGLFNRHFQEIT